MEKVFVVTANSWNGEHDSIYWSSNILYNYAFMHTNPSLEKLTEMILDKNSNLYKTKMDGSLINIDFDNIKILKCREEITIKSDNRIIFMNKDI